MAHLPARTPPDTNSVSVEYCGCAYGTVVPVPVLLLLLIIILIIIPFIVILTINRRFGA